MAGDDYVQVARDELLIHAQKLRYRAKETARLGGSMLTDAGQQMVTTAAALERIAAAPSPPAAATGGGDAVDGFYLASFKHGRNDGTVMWWMPNNAGYSHDLEQAGIYHEIAPGYHASEDTVPVPVWFIERLRVRRVVDYGDSLNTAFHNAKSLRAILAIAQADAARRQAEGGESGHR